MVALPDDPVAAWLRFGLQRHGHVRVIGSRESDKIMIELDRAFVPLWVYADRMRSGIKPNKDGIDSAGIRASPPAPGSCCGGHESAR